MKRRILAKESDFGPRGGEDQDAHEEGREGSGTRPSGTGMGKSGKSGGRDKKADEKGGKK